MNPCIRTGVQWATVDNRDQVKTGDLFLVWDGEFCFQILGIPDGGRDGHPDVIVDDVVIVKRHQPSHYVDTAPGVVIIECTDKFRAFVAEWSPVALPYLPSKVSA